MVRTTIAICCDKCGKVLGGDGPIIPTKCYGRYIDDKGGVEVYLCEECIQEIVKNKSNQIEDKFDMFRNRVDTDTKVTISIELCSTTIGTISTSTTVLTVDIGFIGRSLTDDEDVVIMATNGKFFRRDQIEELIYNIFDYDYIDNLRHKYRLRKNASDKAYSSSAISSNQNSFEDGIALC